MHNYNCEICWPKGAPQYQDKLESYQNLIKSEIDSLSISYQSKLRLEQTVTEVIRTIYFSNRSPEYYIAPQQDYRAEEKIKVLESKYGNLLYDYEHERKLREQLERDLQQFQTKVYYLTELQQECVQKHVGHSQVTEFKNEIDSIKIQNKELFEENRRFKVIINESETLRHQIKALNDEIRYLKSENNEKDSVNFQNKEENKILRSKVGQNSELSESKRSLEAELERKEKRITQILQELEYFKDLHNNFKKEYMKDSSSITQKYEKLLQENQDLKQGLSDLKEKHRRVSRKFQNLSQDFENRESHPSAEPNGFTFKPTVAQPVDLGGENKLKELERRLEELKSQVDKKSSRNGEDSLINSSPANTTVPNFSGYSTWVNHNEKPKRPTEDNECVMIEEEKGGNGDKMVNEGSRRTSAVFSATNNRRRRNSETADTFSSLYRKSLSPSRGKNKAYTSAVAVPEHIACNTCYRKHRQ